jgi:hypothetical protein
VEGGAASGQPKQVTPEEAAAVVARGRQERVAAVQRGIGDLCRAHNCAIEIEMTFQTNGPARGRIVIIPRD